MLRRYRSRPNRRPDLNLFLSACRVRVSEGRLQPRFGASASECAHVLRPSADPKGCEFSDAHVSGEPADPAGAYGNQRTDNGTFEYLPMTASAIL